MARYFAKQKQQNNEQKLIYIGPNLKAGKLIKYTVFKGMPAYLDDIFDKMPEMRSLFVPIANMATAEKEVKTAGTPRNKYYKMALALEVQDGV